MLETNNEVVFTYTPDDPWLRKYLLHRIVGLALYDISIAQEVSTYGAALSVCLVAKDRAEAWGLAGQCPEVYFDCGILVGHLSCIAACYAASRSICFPRLVSGL